jgi:serine/threonine protein kinase
MEYVEGINMKDLINQRKAQNQPFIADEIIRFISQISSALSHLKSLRIIHRDLKPENFILTPEGNFKIIDFVLSKAIEASTQNPQSSKVGTVNYWPPEILLNQQYSFSVDVWAFSIILYQMLTFRHLFERNNYARWIQNILNQSITSINPNYPQDLINLCLHLLSKDQSQRISTESIQSLPFIFKIPIHITPNDLYLLGKKYRFGEGIPINTMEAMKHYKSSANLNDISGMKAYPFVLKKGLAGIINLKEANKF